MNKYSNLPCKSSLATSCAKSVMASSCGEGKVAALFTEGVSSSAERELAIIETASTVSPTPTVFVAREKSVAVREGEECVRDFLDHVSGEESAARYFVLGGEAADNDRAVLLQSAMLSRRVGFCGCAGTYKVINRNVGGGCWRHIWFA